MGWVPGRYLLMNERGRESTTCKGRVAQPLDHKGKFAAGWGRRRPGPRVDLPPPVISTTASHGPWRRASYDEGVADVDDESTRRRYRCIAHQRTPAAFVTAPAHRRFPSRTALASRPTMPAAPQGPSARRR